MSFLHHISSHAGRSRRVRTLSLFALAALMSMVGSSATEGVASAEGTPKARIVVEISGFKNNSGETLLALYADEAAFPTKANRAFRWGRSKVSGKHARIELPNIPDGDYAISAFHDENQNGTLDTNFLGIPKEAVGVSNNPRPRLGTPRWKDSKFRVRGGVVVQRIQLKSF